MSARRFTHTPPLADDPPELVAFSDYQRRRNLAPRTIAVRARLIRSLAAWLEGPLTEATPADLRRFLARPRPKVARVTHFGDVSTLRTFYAGLRELELVDVSPAQGLRCLNVPSPRQPISLERVQEILVESSNVRGEPTPYALALSLRDRACLELLFATGMRASEVGDARVVDVDLDDASVLVRRAKRGHSRVIPLPSSGVDALRRYVVEGRAALVTPDEDDQGLLFLNTCGGPLTGDGVYKVVRKVSERCGVPTYPHAFRRTLATELARAGASLPLIQEVMGHAHITTTAAYVQVDVVDMRSVLDELDRKRPKTQVGSALFANLQRRLFLEWQFQAAQNSDEMAVQSSMGAGRQSEAA